MLFFVGIMALSASAIRLYLTAYAIWLQEEYQYILAASEEAKVAKTASHSILSLNLRPQLTWAIL